MPLEAPVTMAVPFEELPMVFSFETGSDQLSTHDGDEAKAQNRAASVQSYANTLTR